MSCKYSCSEGPSYIFHLLTLNLCSCGSKDGKSPEHLKAATALGNALANAGYSLVYGGGTTGIMGEVGRTMASNKNCGPENVEGIIPTPLIEHEQSNRPSGIEESVRGDSANETLFGRTTEVGDMHERQDLMAKRVMEGGPGSGFIALSGGYGTLAEQMEVITFNQIGVFGCPIIFFSVNGYWTKILEWVKEAAVPEGFVSEQNAKIAVEATDAEGVIKALRKYVPSGDRLKLGWQVIEAEDSETK